MGDLIFTLPFLIILVFILAQIFLVIKKGIDFIKRELKLTISEADKDVEKNNKSMSTDFNQSEVKKRIAEAEKNSLAESKERILAQSSAKKSEEAGEKKRQKRISEKNNLGEEQRRKNSRSFAKIFSQYNEIQKAVIYNEILSKPKSLKRK